MNDGWGQRVADVVLVHGLWYRAWSMRVLAGRLSTDGFRCHAFSYPTRKRGLDENAALLAGFCSNIRAPELHFLGHSLGGLLITQTLRANPHLPPGRVVLLGTPLRGSAVAARSTGLPGGKFLLGLSAITLAAGAAVPLPDRDTGMIAGTRPHGLGRLTGGLAGPNDGTVSVSETVSDALRDRIELPVTHTGMLVSFRVAEQASHFLAHGRFDRS